MDVARILVRTKSWAAINNVLNVNINNEEFEIRVVEDWCSPTQWCNPDEKKDPESSSEEEDSDGGTQWRESSSEEALGVEDALSDTVVEATLGCGSNNCSDASLSKPDSHKQEANSKNAMLHVSDSYSHVSDSVIPPGSVQSDLGCGSLVGHIGVSASISPIENAPLIAQGVVEALGCVSGSFLAISSSKVHGVAEASSRPIQSSGSRDLPPLPKSKSVSRSSKPVLGFNLNSTPSVGSSESSLSSSFRKERRIEMARAAFSANSEEFPSSHTSSQAIPNSVGGPGLSGASIGDSGIQVGSNRFWVLQRKNNAKKVWNMATTLGVEGDRPDSVYVDLIEAAEVRDQAAKDQREKKKGAS